MKLQLTFGEQLWDLRFRRLSPEAGFEPLCKKNWGKASVMKN